MLELQWLATAFPNFVRYVVVGFALAGLFLLIYTLITPWREFTLIRAGNSAAATALVGALLGFCLPLANAIAQASSLTDVVLWALVALVVQVIVHLVMRLALPQLSSAIEADRPAAGIAAGGFAACFGLINAACLTS
jgi:putative membrane protein